MNIGTRIYSCTEDRIIIPLLHETVLMGSRFRLLFAYGPGAVVSRHCAGGQEKAQRMTPGSLLDDACRYVYFGEERTLKFE